MSKHDLLDRFSDQKLALRGKRFFAPYFTHSSVVVRMLGANYRFRVVGFQNYGFGIFQPIDLSCAKFIKESDTEYTEKYLKMFPSVRVILISETDIGWCGYLCDPNVLDNKNIHARTVIVHNVVNARRFDVVLSRVDTFSRFWYDAIVDSSSMKSHEMRKCFMLKSVIRANSDLKKIEGISSEDAKAFELALESRRIFIRSEIQRNLDSSFLEDLYLSDNFIIKGQQIESEWMFESGASNTLIAEKKNCGALSLGIYLDGENTKFSLKNVSEMTESHG